MRGAHIDELMTGCGVLVINKVHASAKTAARQRQDHRPHAGTPSAPGSTTPHGPCTHQLAAVDGAVSEIGLDETGTPGRLGRLERRQVKRPRRATGRYHFNVAYEVPCPAGGFLAWVTPHAEPGDTEHRRADAVRVIAEGEPDFTGSTGSATTPKAFNSQLKRTLLVDRAMSLGGAPPTPRRPLLRAAQQHHQRLPGPTG